MSFSGISKVKNSKSIFVDKEKRGILSNNTFSSKYQNVEYMIDLSYTNSEGLTYLGSTTSTNITQTLSSPTSSYVNLSFTFINVDSSTAQRQMINSFSNDQKSIVVENNLSYTYTKNIVEKNNVATKTINVLSTNSEHNITLNLNNKSLPEIETFYQNYEVANDIELSEDEVWS
jgi:hypothetical protein